MRACKPAVSARSSSSLQYIAHNAAATSTVASLHSHPLSTSSVAPSPTSSGIPMKSLTESGIQETPRDGRHLGVNINTGPADISPDFSGCGLQKPGRRVSTVGLNRCIVVYCTLKLVIFQIFTVTTCDWLAAVAQWLPSRKHSQVMCHV